MKKNLLFLPLISISWVYSTDVSQSTSPETSVVLCNGDICMQATISPYDADRDRLGVEKLLNKNQLRPSHITLESLDPYFSHKVEAFEQASPAGFTVTGNFTYSAYVLRDSKNVVGFIAYMITALKEPNPVTTGTIVLLSVEPAYQGAGEEQLLKYAVQDMSHKKSISVNIIMHEENASQCGVVEKMGFTDFSQQVKAQQKAMAERFKKLSTEQQKTVGEIPETEHNCYYMKYLEENVTEEMKNPAPIESSLLNIKQENFEQEVLNADKPVVIDVYADWCGPCRQFAPIFEEAAADHTAYTFVRFNCVKEEQELVQKLGIEALPTILFVKGGKVVGRETGFMSKEIVQQKLTEYFDSTSGQNNS